MNLKRSAALLLVCSLLTGCTTSSKKEDGKYVVATLQKGDQEKNIFADDLYNKMIPIFWGPLKVFISNNIKTSEYAKSVTSPVYIIGSKADKTLGESLQEKLSDCFENSELKIFNDITHENYFISEDVVKYINNVIQ